MRIDLVLTVFGKEWREISSNRLLLGAVAAPAIIFAAIPTAIVAFIQVNDLDMSQLGQIESMLSAFPGLPPKLAAQGFIVTNFMAYFLLIPAMVPIAIASQSVIGERQARSLEPQLATPLAVSELLAGKVIAAALPAVLATWIVWVAYGLINAAIADPRLLRMVFSPQWIVAMASLVPADLHPVGPAGRHRQLAGERPAHRPAVRRVRGAAHHRHRRGPVPGRPGDLHHDPGPRGRPGGHRSDRGSPGHRFVGI